MRRYKVVCGRDQHYYDNRAEALFEAWMLKNDDVHGKHHIYVVVETLIWLDGETYSPNRKVVDVDVEANSTGLCRLGQDRPNLYCSGGLVHPYYGSPKSTSD